MSPRLHSILITLCYSCRSLAVAFSLNNLIRETANRTVIVLVDVIFNKKYNIKKYKNRDTKWLIAKYKIV